MTQEDCMLSGTLFIIKTKEMVFLMYSIIKYFTTHFYRLLNHILFFVFCLLAFCYALNVLFVHVLQSLNIWNVVVQTHHYICSFMIIIKYSNKIFEVHAEFFLQEWKHIESEEAGEYIHYPYPPGQAYIRVIFVTSICLFTVPTSLLSFNAVTLCVMP